MADSIPPSPPFPEPPPPPPPGWEQDPRRPTRIDGNIRTTGFRPCVTPPVDPNAKRLALFAAGSLSASLMTPAGQAAIRQAFAKPVTQVQPSPQKPSFLSKWGPVVLVGAALAAGGAVLLPLLGALKGGGPGLTPRFSPAAGGGLLSSGSAPEEA